MASVLSRAGGVMRYCAKYWRGYYPLLLLRYCIVMQLATILLFSFANYTTVPACSNTAQNNTIVSAVFQYYSTLLVLWYLWLDGCIIVLQISSENIWSL